MLPYPKPQRHKKSDYEKLRDKWYKKLKKAGFEDIEQDEYNLKKWSSLPALKTPATVWYAKVEYYNLADRFLHEHKFESELEKIIWEYHANAVSTRNIAKLLKKVRVTDMCYVTVWRIINKLKQIMLRMYVNKPDSNRPYYNS